MPTGGARRYQEASGPNINRYLTYENKIKEDQYIRIQEH